MGADFLSLQLELFIFCGRSQPRPINSSLCCGAQRRPRRRQSHMTLSEPSHFVFSVTINILKLEHKLGGFYPVLSSSLSLPLVIGVSAAAVLDRTTDPISSKALQWLLWCWRGPNQRCHQLLSQVHGHTKCWVQITKSDACRKWLGGTHQIPSIQMSTLDTCTLLC